MPINLRFFPLPQSTEQQETEIQSLQITLLHSYGGWDPWTEKNFFKQIS